MSMAFDAIPQAAPLKLQLVRRGFMTVTVLPKICDPLNDGCRIKTRLLILERWVLIIWHTMYTNGMGKV